MLEEHWCACCAFSGSGSCCAVWPWASTPALWGHWVSWGLWCWAVLLFEAVKHKLCSIVHAGKRSCDGLSTLRDWGTSSELAEGNCAGGVDIVLQLHLVHYEEWSALNVCLVDVTAEQSVSPYVLWGVLCEGTAGSLVWFWFVY